LKIKLKNQKETSNKKKCVATLLICIFVVSIFAFPTVSSQVTGTKKTYAFVGANPNPVEVGKEVAIHFGITHEVGGPTSGWN
jgi:hypothetical protein